MRVYPACQEIQEPRVSSVCLVYQDEMAFQDKKERLVYQELQACLV